MYANLPNMLTYKVHTGEQEAPWRWPKDVRGINKHCGIFGIMYCRYTVVAQKMYNIKFVFTMFSTGHRLYLSWAR